MRFYLMRFYFVLILVSLLLLGCVKSEEEKAIGGCNSETPDLESCFELAYLLYEDKKFPVAMNIYKNLCEHNMLTACFETASLYEKGLDNVSPDIGRSIYYYGKLCNEDDFSGCKKIEHIYANGANDSPPNIDKLFFHYSKVCGYGDYHSCFKLGIMHHAGNGEYANLEKAPRLYKISCGGGVENACIAYANISQEMNLESDKECIDNTIYTIYKDSFLEAKEKNTKNTTYNFTKMMFACKALGKIYSYKYKPIVSIKSCQAGWASAVEKSELLPCQTFLQRLPNLLQ